MVEPGRDLAIALLQLDPCGTEAEALKVGLEACRQAQALGAEVAVFPELWNTGYRFPAEGSADALEAWQRLALDETSSFVKAFRALARELGLIIALTYLEKTTPGPRNTVVLIDRNGEIVHRYAKVHTCAFGPERWCVPGEEFFVTSLETSVGPVKFGTMICFDREFPESARILMLQGAEIVLVPNASEWEPNRRGQFQARAFENMTAMVLANYASGEGDGGSVAFDGVAFEYDEANDRCVSRSQVVVEAGREAGVYLARVPLDRLRAFRQLEVWGNAYRRPETYGLLTSRSVAEPFVRPDSRVGAS